MFSWKEYEKMIIKLTEVFQVVNDARNPSYSLREIYVNPEHVVALRSAVDFEQKLNEGQLPLDLDERQNFTRIYMNRGHSGLDVVVVGNPSLVEKKIKKNTKQLLKG